MIYLDSSALLKLIFDEKYSRDLRAYVEARTLTSSIIAHIEIHRSLRRHELPVQKAFEILQRIDYLAVTNETARLSEIIPGTQLRTLDAIHIATAYNVGATEFITYDARQFESAREIGLLVKSPGSPA